MEVKTMRIASDAKGTGGYIVINESDFDPKVHKKYEDKTAAETNKDGKLSVAELKAALDAKGVAYKGNASKAELQSLLDDAQ